MNELRIAVGERVGEVEACLLRPPDAWVLYVLAHGAGAGMHHPWLLAQALALADRGVATLRYFFPYMQARRGRPDPEPVLLATVRAAIATAAEHAPDLPRIAGGKSMGGRMTSRLLAREPAAVDGLAFLGFPLHRAKEPDTSRADHLREVTLPMLFVQGTRDALARFDLVTTIVEALGPRARMCVIEGADHGFAVPKRSGRSESDVHAEIADAVVAFARAIG